MPKKKKGKEPDLVEETEETEDNSLQQMLFFEPSTEQSSSKIRILSLCGEIEEEKAGDICFSMIALREMGKEEVLENPEDEESDLIEIYEPFTFNISTYGGSAVEMFAIYDTMRMVRRDCEIHTFGLGKVMSAGVLLLASGTKGKRKIGKNCRVMLHSVVAGSHGAIHNLENEMEEIRVMQEQHIDCLVEETDMTKRYLKKLLNRKMNVYLTAEEAVELGIADEVV